MTSFYSNEELLSIGFKSIGEKVYISRKASFYGVSEIKIGNNVRIDDFCILSGNITIGNNIHISAYVALYGAKGITLCDYTGISPHSTIYSAMDDFSGDYLIGPIHDPMFTHVTGGPVILERLSHIGCNSVVFPNITIPEGTIIGAMTLVNRPLLPWSIYHGIPAKKIKDRSKKVLDFI